MSDDKCVNVTPAFIREVSNLYETLVDHAAEDDEIAKMPNAQLADELETTPIDGRGLERRAALICEAGKRLRTLEAYELRHQELVENVSSFLFYIREGQNKRAHLQMLVLEILLEENKK